jgi:hypothetical protein
MHQSPRAAHSTPHTNKSLLPLCQRLFDLGDDPLCPRCICSFHLSPTFFWFVLLQATGSLKEDFDILKPKEIDDPESSKPSDWVDETKIDDPEDKKPADWVEEAKIIDPEAEKVRCVCCLSLL